MHYLIEFVLFLIIGYMWHNNCALIREIDRIYPKLVKAEHELKLINDDELVNKLKEKYSLTKTVNYWSKSNDGV